MASLLAQINRAEAAREKTAADNQARWRAQKLAKHQVMLQAFLDIMGIRRKVKGDTLELEGLTFTVKPMDNGYDAIVILGTCPQCGNDTHTETAVSSWYTDKVNRGPEEVAKARVAVAAEIARLTRPHFKPHRAHWKMCEDAYALRDIDPEAVEAWVRYASLSGDSGLFARNGFLAGWMARQRLLDASPCVR